MEVKLAVGAEVDIASGKEISDQTDRLVDAMNARPSYQYRSGTVAAPTTNIVYVGRPAVGRIWNILGLTICGETDAVQSTAGTVAFYIGDLPQGGATTLSQVRQTRMSVPFTVAYGENVLWCSPQDTLFFNLVGMTGLAQFVGTVWIAEYRAEDILQKSGR